MLRVPHPPARCESGRGATPASWDSWPVLKTGGVRAGAYFRVGAGLGVPPSRDPPILLTESEPSRGQTDVSSRASIRIPTCISADESVAHLFPSTLSAAAGKACPRPLRRPLGHKPRELPVLRRVGQTAPTTAEGHR